MHDLPERLTLGARGEPNRLLLADALALLGTLADGSVDLVYADPPFATGQVRRAADGAGVEHRYDDLLDDPDAYRAWLEPHLAEFHRVLAPTGSLFLHLDHRMSAYARIALDAVFGRAGFRNEIVWRYGLGGRAPANAFARKHDVLLFYARGPANTFHRLRGGVTPAMEAKYAHVDEHGRYQNAHGRRYYLKGGKPFDSVWDIPSIAPTAARARRLPDAEAARAARARDRRDHRPRRARRRPLRRQRHDGRRGAAPGPPLRVRRQLAAGDRGHLRPPEREAQRIRRPMSSFRALDSRPDRLHNRSQGNERPVANLRPHGTRAVTRQESACISTAARSSSRSRTSWTNRNPA